MGHLRVEPTAIDGLLIVHLQLHGDTRGWFKENWQRAEMTALGVPDFGPVQNNVSWNASRGVTRGIHAEPWDKLVSLATGRAFGAWVDLRAGDGFGTVVTLEIGPETAVFVPRGVGNSYQALEDGTAYTYLVNDHWRPGTSYPAVDLADPSLSIPWPIPPAEAEISQKDRTNPRLADVAPFARRRPLVIGGGGQLGRALAARFPHAVVADLSDLDITDAAQMAAWSWGDHDVVLNAAAYTAVDAAETPEGRRAAWATNARAPAALAALAREHGFTLVHYSTDYVYDGTTEVHREDEPLAPLGVYGQSKAAGDLAVAAAPRHYLLRTSWVVGDGANFVATMRRLAEEGVSPAVVGDQVGRLTFTDTLADATAHLLRTGAHHGTYHCSNGGPPTSWADVARAVFALSGRAADDVSTVSTQEYGAGRSMAPRPRFSTLDLTKLRATGFEPEDAMTALERRLSR